MTNDTNEPSAAATGSESDTWRVHILGPDEIIPMPDELEALRQCNMTNIMLSHLRRKYANDPNYPWSMAVVERNGIAVEQAEGHKCIACGKEHAGCCGQCPEFKALTPNSSVSL